MIADQNEGHTRYRLLETVRQYAEKKLSHCKTESRTVYQRHLDYFACFAEQAEPHFRGPEQAQWLDRMEVEHDNLRAALGQSITGQSGANVGLRLCGAAWRFWYARGYFSEGRMFLTALLEVEGTSARTLERAKALHGAGTLAWQQGDYPPAKQMLEDSLSIRREHNDRVGIGKTLQQLGMLARYQGDMTSARALLEESRNIRVELEDREGIADVSFWLGSIARDQRDYKAARRYFEEAHAVYKARGNKEDIANVLLLLGVMANEQEHHAEARILYKESLALYRKLGVTVGIGITFSNMGIVAREQGEYKEARSLLKKALKLLREVGAKEDTACALVNLANVAICEDKVMEARSCLEESLELYRELEDQGGIACVLESFAGMAAKQGQPEKAARLICAAQALRDAINMPLPPNEQREYDRHFAAAQQALAQQVFEVACEKGHTMTLDEAIEYALSP